MKLSRKTKKTIEMKNNTTTSSALTNLIINTPKKLNFAINYNFTLLNTKQPLECSICVVHIYLRINFLSLYPEFVKSPSVNFAKRN